MPRRAKSRWIASDADGANRVGVQTQDWVERWRQATKALQVWARQSRTAVLAE
jgi:hypothetical protein